MALIEKLTNIADAIREKTGGTEPLSLDGMAEAIAGISAGGGDEQSVLDSLIDRSITEIRSNVTSIGQNAFYGCSVLTSADFPLATSVGASAFYKCTSLKIVNLPSATTFETAAFYGCRTLENANLPSAKTFLNQMFYQCSKLASIKLPLLETMGASAFYSCINLTKADFSSLQRLGISSFSGCSRLTAVILRSDTLCALSNVNSFQDCYHFHGTVNATYNPEGLKDGYIYVPAALIEDYKVATNWSTFATQFRALEDYTVDGTTTGALDLSKI